MLEKVLSGRYKIIQHLGSGGFGQTFLAEDLHLPDAYRCVVKQLQPQNNHPEALEIARTLFNREAQVLHRLGEHPQIPRLFAHFEENQEFYLVQEFIEGQDLSGELVSGKQFSQSYVLTLLEDLLGVLQFVHSQDVIHRDLKPSNLIRRFKDGKIVVIDFGAVKQIGAQTVRDGQTSITVAIGSPGYMPNEQYSGKPRFCSDLYAVGMIAIQALTGINPTKLPEDPQTGEIQWRDQARVSPELADILDQLIYYDFRQRYATVEAVLTSLATIPQCPSTISYPVSSPAPQTIASTTIGQATPLQVTPAPVTLAPPLSELDTEKAIAPATSRWFRPRPVLLLGGVVLGVVGLSGGGYLYQQWQNHQRDQVALAAAQTLKGTAKYQECVSQLQLLSAPTRATAQSQSLLQECQVGQAKQLAAKKQWQAAIATAIQIPRDSEIGTTVKPLLDQWSKQLLQQATDRYQAGQLNEALALVKAIPQETTVKKNVPETIARWQKAWASDHARWKLAQTALSGGDWQKVLDETAKMSKTPYWQQKTASIIKTAQARLEAAAQASRSIPVSGNATSNDAGYSDPGYSNSGYSNSGSGNSGYDPAPATGGSAYSAPQYVPPSNPAPEPVPPNDPAPAVPSYAPVEPPVAPSPPPEEPTGCAGSVC